MDTKHLELIKQKLAEGLSCGEVARALVASGIQVRAVDVRNVQRDVESEAKMTVRKTFHRVLL